MHLISENGGMPELRADLRRSINKLEYDNINWNQSRLFNEVKEIFFGRRSYILEETAKEYYNQSSNELFHYDTVMSLISRVKQERKSFILSLVSIMKKPVLDIYVQASLSVEGNLEFSIYGKDLRKYFQLLPKIKEYKNGKVYLNNPRIGSKHSRWYPQQCQNMIVKIAVYLRILDIYIKKNHVNISDSYSVSSTGILGLEVPFDIPENFKDFISEDEINSDSNPSKIKEGIFRFKLNGVSDTISTKTLNIISSNFSNIFSYLLNIENLHEFFKSDCTFGIFSWNHHARILHRVNNKVYVLDPWKRFLNDDIIEQMNSINKDIACIFVPRNIKDQCDGEASCILSAISRMLFLALLDSNVSDAYSQPIPDFFAFFASFFYRK